MRCFWLIVVICEEFRFGKWYAVCVVVLLLRTCIVSRHFVVSHRFFALFLRFSPFYYHRSRLIVVFFVGVRGEGSGVDSTGFLKDYKKKDVIATKLESLEKPWQSYIPTPGISPVGA